MNKENPEVLFDDIAPPILSQYSYICGFPPHPHGWFGFVDRAYFSRERRYVKGKTRLSDFS
jgi:hypothetical protein